MKVTAKNSLNQLVAVTAVKVDEIGGNTVDAITGFNASGPYRALVGQTITLNASVTAGGNVVYTWNFGDGEIARGSSVAHAYDKAGLYTVGVTASNETDSKSLSLVIEVKQGLFMPMLTKK